MLHTINAENVINLTTERHYAFCEQIDPKQYPQVHDFYEITLVVQGTMAYLLNGEEHLLSRGSFLLVRPGDIHSKIARGHCQHINLAFPQSTVDGLFSYLYPARQKEIFLALQPHIPVCRLSPAETTLLQEKLARLHFLPLDSPSLVKTTLRKLLLDIIADCFMPAVAACSESNALPSLPSWILQITEGLNDVENLSHGMEYLIAASGRTTEHVCRAFQKYLHVTPNTYLNAKRLTYAANMLSHTDTEIVDIAFEVGFLSLSHFYKLFKAEFGVTPRQFRLAGYHPL